MGVVKSVSLGVVRLISSILISGLSGGVSWRWEYFEGVEANELAIEAGTGGMRGTETVNGGAVGARGVECALMVGRVTPETAGEVMEVGI